MILIEAVKSFYRPFFGDSVLKLEIGGAHSSNRHGFHIRKVFPKPSVPLGVMKFLQVGNRIRLQAAERYNIHLCG